MGLSAFLLAVANVFFFWGLGIYIRIQQGWAMAWAVGSGLVALVAAGVEVTWPEVADGWLGVATGVVTLGAVGTAGWLYWLGRERPDFTSTGHLFIMHAVLGGAATAAVWGLEWPLRW